MKEKAPQFRGPEEITKEEREERTRQREIDEMVAGWEKGHIYEDDEQYGSIAVYEPQKMRFYAGGGGNTGGVIREVKNVGDIKANISHEDGQTYPSGTATYWVVDLIDGARVLVDGQLTVGRTGIAEILSAESYLERKRVHANTVANFVRDPENKYRKTEVGLSEHGLEITVLAKYALEQKRRKEEK